MDRPPWSQCHGLVHRELRGRSLLPSGAAVIVAVSGGQDSIALLKLLVDLQPKWHWRLLVAHCDHRWRPDSAANGAFVQELCRQWRVACQIITAKTILRTEAAARQWRYGVLAHLAQAEGCTHIATGHTASDRAETLLYNLLRGSGTDGLQALVWQRPLAADQPDVQVVRPLLALTRQDTAGFCQQFGLTPWPDATNQDLAYARNRLRLAVLPYLRTHFNPTVDRTLAQTAEILTAEVALLDQQAQAVYDQTVECDAASTGWRIHRPGLRAVHLALQRRVLRRVLGQAIPTQVSFAQVEKLVALLTAPNRTQTDPFPGGAVAIVAADWILLDGRSVPPTAPLASLD